MEGCNQKITKVSPHHHDLALGKIDDLGGLVDYHKTKCNQSVDTAGNHPAQQKLQENMEIIHKAPMRLCIRNSTLMCS